MNVFFVQKGPFLMVFFYENLRKDIMLFFLPDTTILAVSVGFGYKSVDKLKGTKYKFIVLNEKISKVRF